MIALVFVAGLIKLWHNNRLLKKHTLLDEEKSARQTEMRRSGLPVGKRIDIPFGVRAIQSGIEVDGIWISRTATPVGSESATLLGSARDPLGKGKGKGKALSDATSTLRGPPTNGAYEAQATPDISPTPSLSGHHTPYDNTSGPVRSMQNGQQSTYMPRQTASPRLPSFTFNENAAAVETYVPTTSYFPEQSSAPTHHRVPIDRTSGSSDENGRWNPYRASRHQDTPAGSPGENEPFMQTGSPETDGYFPPPEPEARAGRASTYHSASQNRKSRMASRESFVHRQQSSFDSNDSNVAPPKRSYSGETHANVTSRRVNANFEVLPAGTFSRTNSQNDNVEEDESSSSHRRIPSVHNKLRKNQS